MGARIRVRAQRSRMARVKLASLALLLTLVAATGFGLARPQIADATTSNNLNFQARLENINGAIALDGDYNVEFKLYDAPSGGTALWTEDYLVSASQAVHVVNGYLTVNLASITPFPSTISWDQQLYVTMNIGGTTSSPSWDGEMNPRLLLTAVPYAFQAKSASQLQVTSSGNTTTLQVATPTANNTITLPDLSGEVCLGPDSDNPTANNCGFAAGSGSSAYIQNGTALQAAANFNVQEDSTANSNGDATATIQQLTGQTTDLLRFENGAGTAALSGVNSSGQVYYQSGSFTGTILQASLAHNTSYELPAGNGAQHLCTFEAGNCAGSGSGITGSGTTNYVARFNTSATLDASTLLYDDGSIIGVNNITGAAQLDVSSTNASQSAVYIQGANSATAPALVIQTGTTPGTGGDFADFIDSGNAVVATVQSNGDFLTAGSAVLGSATTPTGTIGELTVQSPGGSTVGAVVRAGASQSGDLLELQDSSGLINGSFDATGAQLSLGRKSLTGVVTQGSIVFSDGTNDNFGLTLQAGSPTNPLTADQTITIPDAAGNDTVCLESLANCTGTGGGIAGAGTQHYIAVFDTAGGNHIASLDSGNASVYDNGSFFGIGTGATSPGGLLSVQGNAAAQSSLFVVGPASATAPVAVIKGGATPGSGADLLDLATSATTVVTFDKNGNFHTTGSATIDSGATVTGTTTINGTGSTAATTIGSNNSNTAVTLQDNSASSLVLNTSGTSITGTLGVSGLTTLSGGLTATGTTNINVTGTANTSIGNSTGNFTLVSSGLNVNSSGQITTTTSGTINGVNISSGALSAIAGITYGSSGNFDQSASTTGTFKTGGGAVSLNGDTTIATGKTLTVSSFGAGVVQSSSAGLLSSSALNLASSSLVSGILPVANGGTGANTLAANGVLYGNGTSAVGVTNSLADAVLITDHTTSQPSLSQTLPTVVQGNITGTGALASGSIASGFGAISTTNAITTTGTITGKILNATGVGSAIELGGVDINTGGTLSNVAYLDQSNTFSGTTNTFQNAVIVQGTGGLTLGTNSSAGLLTLTDGAGNNVSFASATQANDVAITVPADTHTTDTLCLQTLANCASSLTGSGTTNYVVRWTGTNSLGKGLLYDTGTGGFSGSNITSQLDNSTFGVAAQTGQVALAAEGVAGQDIADFLSSSAAVVASIDSTGKLTAVGVDAGAGQITGTGGINVTGTTAFNTSGTASTTIGSATSNTAITLQDNAASSLVLNTSGTSITGTLGISGLATLSGGLTDTGTTLINTTGTAATTIGSATTNTAITLQDNSASTLTLNTTGTSVTGTLGVSGLSTLSGGATVTGATNINTTGTATTTIGSATTNTSVVLQNNSASSLTLTTSGTNIAGLLGVTTLDTTGSHTSTLCYDTTDKQLASCGAGSLVPNGGNFILNGTSQQTSANFNIDGSGTIGNGLTVSAGGASVLGTTTINTSGTAATTIGSATTNTAVTLQDNAASSLVLNTSGTSITGTLGVSGLTTLSGGLTDTGTTLINTTGTSATTIGSATTNTSVTLQDNSASSLVLNTTGTSITGTLGVSGLATLSGGLTDTGTTQINTSGTASTTIGSATTNTGITLQDNSTSSLVLGTSGTSITGTLSATGLATLSGNAVLGSTTTNGTLNFLDGTVDGFKGKIQLGGAIAADQTYTLPTTGGTFCLQTSSACGFESTTGTDFIRNQSSQQTSANFNIDGSGTIGNGLTVSAGGANITGVTTINGTGSTSATTIGSNNSNTAVTLQDNAASSLALNTTGTTITGTLDVSGLGTFSSGLTIATGNTFTNASSSLFTAKNLGNLASGSIGSAATTVDVATTFDIPETTASQSFTLPSPTVTTAGRLIYINNTGTQSFTIGSVTLNSGAGIVYIWNGSSWVALTSGSSVAGVTTIGGLDTPSFDTSADGATISGNTLYLQSATATVPGLVNTGTQSFAGDKTFGNALTVSGLTTLNGGLTDTGTTQINTSGTAATTIGSASSNTSITLQDNSTSSLVLNTSGTSITGTLGVSGLTTLSGGLTDTGTTQINTSGTAATTIGSATSNTAITLQDNAASSLVINTSGSSITGTLGVSGLTTLSGGLTDTGTTQINTSGTAATTIGSATSNTTVKLQNNSASSLTVNTGGTSIVGTLTVGTFGSAANDSVVCQNAGVLSSCNDSFETTTGNDFIKNQTTAATIQSANEFFQANGATVASTIRGNSAADHDILDLQTGAAGNAIVAKFDASGNLSAGTINGLTLATAADGFTAAGGTTSRTLTVTGADITIGSTIKPTSAGALSIQSNGANALNLDTGAASTINIAGASGNATALNIGTNSSVSQAVALGSSKNGTTVTLSGGASGLQVANSGTSITGTLSVGTFGSAANDAVVCQNGGVLSACTDSFESTTGNDFIKNQTTAATIQSANEFFQANGATVAATIRGNSAANQDILDLQTGAAGNAVVASFSATGALTAVGVNSGTGLIQGTGGLTVSGATSLTGATTINTTGTAATTIGSSSSNTAVTLQDNSASSLVLNTTGTSVTGTLGVSGLATLSGGATVTGATNINTTGTATTTIGSATTNTSVVLQDNSASSLTVNTTGTSILGTLTVGTFGAAANDTVVCRNSGVLSSCNDAFAIAPASGFYLQQVPTSNTANAAGANIISPTAASIVGLTVKGTTNATSAHVLDIYNSAASPTLQDYFDSSGSLNVNQKIQATSSVDIGASGAAFANVYGTTLFAGATNLTSTALTFTGAGTVTSTGATALTVDTGGAATLSLGTAHANAISIGKLTVVTTNIGDFNIGSSAGSGTNFVNNGTTQYGVLAINNTGSNGPIGGLTAAQSVDIYSAFSINQSATGKAFTVPTPTNSTAYGRVIYVSNISPSVSFTLNGTVLAPGASATLIWANTNGGATWQFTGADGSSILNQNSASQTANFRITGSGQADTSFLTPSLDVASAGTLSIGTGTATAITIGKTGVTATVTGGLTVTQASQLNGGVTLGASAGSGSLLTNNGATVNSTLALTNFNYTGSGNTGSIGSAASTVDLYTSISIAQTTASQTLTIPNPTASTAYGRLLYIANVGTTAFTLGGIALNPGSTATMVWENTNGAASWQFAGADGSSILNQNSVNQSANFRISGTGQANTSFTSPLFDALSGGALSLGTSNATGITIGKVGVVTTIGGSLTVTTLAATGGNNVVCQSSGTLGTCANSFETTTGTDFIKNQTTAASIQSANEFFQANGATVASTIRGNSAADHDILDLQTGAAGNAIVAKFDASGNLTVGTINGLTLATASDGFTAAGGSTSSRTLTVTGADITVGNTIKPTSAGTLAIQSNGANTLSLDTGGASTINIAGATGNATAINIGTNSSVTQAIGIGSSKNGTSVTLTGGASSLQVANAGTSITGTLTVGTFGSAANNSVVCQNGGLLTSCTNSFETTTGNDFIKNQTTGASIQSANFFFQANGATVAATIRGNSAATQDILDLQTGAAGNAIVAKFDASGNLAAGTINGLTLAAAADGFTVAGGNTNSRQLTLTGQDITLGTTIKPTNSNNLSIDTTGANTLSLAGNSGAATTINIGSNSSIAQATTIGSTNASAGVTLKGGAAALQVTNSGTSITGTLTVGTFGSAANNTVVCQNAGVLTSCQNSFAVTPASGSYIKQTPALTADNTIQTATTGVVGLSIKGKSAATDHLLDIYNSLASPTLQAFFDSAGSLNVSQKIQAASSVDIGASGAAFANVYGTTLFAGATNLTATQLNFTGAGTVQSATNTALTVQSQGTGQLTLNSAGAALLLQTGGSTRAQIDTSGNLEVGTTGAASGRLVVQGAASGDIADFETNGSSTPTVLINSAGQLQATTKISSSNTTTGLALTGVLAGSGSAALLQVGSGTFTGSGNGTFIGVSAPAASTADLLNLENNGTSLFKVDSSGNATSTGTVLSVTGNATTVGSVQLGNTQSGNYDIINAAAPASGTGNVTFNFPSLTAGATAEICVDTGNCSTAGGGVKTTNGGTQNYVPVFTATHVIENSDIYDDYTNHKVSIGGSSPASLFNIGSGNALQVDNSGNITNTGTYNSNTFTSSSLQFGTAGAATIQAASGQQLNINGLGTSNGAVVIGNGSSAATQITLQDGSSNKLVLDNTNGVAITGAMSASGAVTFSATPTSTVPALKFTGNIAANANSTMLQLSSSAISSPASGGTYIGIKQAVSGTADFLNFQDSSGNVKFKVDSSGNVTAAGNVSLSLASAANNTAVCISGTTLASCTNSFTIVPTSGFYLQQIPTSTTAGAAGANIVAPATASVVALTLEANSVGSPHILDITNAGASTINDFFDSTGSLNVAQKIQPTTNNAVDLGLSGTTFRTGYFGTSVVTPLVTSAAATDLAINPGSNSVVAGTGNTLILQGGVESDSGGTGGNVQIDAGLGGAAAPGSIQIGTTHASSITVGNNTDTTSIALNAKSTLNLGTNNSNKTVNIGNTSNSFTATTTVNVATSTDATQTVNIGSAGNTSTGTGQASVTNIAAGTGGVNVSTGAPVSVAGSGTTAGAIALQGGAGGATSGTTGQTGGTGSTISLNGGAGGNAASGSTNGNGGNITLQGGAAGSGTGSAGNIGNITLQASGGKVGIGTSGTPSQLLAVGGTTGNLTVDTSGNIVTAGTAAINGGTISSTATSFNLLATTVTTGTVLGVATTINLANSAASATTINLGATSGASIIGGGALTIKSGNTNSNLTLQAVGTGTASLDTATSGSGSATVGATNALTVTVGNGTGGETLNLKGGTGGIVATSTGNISLTASGTATADLETNTGAITIGTAATAHSTTVGSTTSSSQVVLQSNASSLTASNTGMAIGISNGSAFTVQNTSTSTTLLSITAAASNNLVVIGTSSNNITLSGTSTNPYEPLLNGTARHPISVGLAPEYPGAVLTGDGSNNIGTMTSDFCSSTTASGGKGGLAINTSICNTNGDEHSYYSWTASATNDYEVWVHYQVPSNFSDFATTNAFTFAGRRDSSSDAVTATIYNGSTNCGTITISSNAAWQTVGINRSSLAAACLSGGANPIAANTIITFDVHLSVGVTNEFARAGEIVMNYLSSY